MRLRTTVVAGALLAGLVSLDCFTAKGWLGTGISCEPVDIRGGGFFADIMWNARLFDLGDLGYISARPMFSVGPLPLRVQWFIMDGFFIAEFPFRDFTLYAGAGFGIVFSTAWQVTNRSVVTVVGLSNVSLGERLQMYVQIRVRGEGFFASPGFGIQWEF